MKRETKFLPGAYEKDLILNDCPEKHFIRLVINTDIMYNNRYAKKMIFSIVREAL